MFFPKQVRCGVKKVGRGGWMGGPGLGSNLAPFMFPFWAPGPRGFHWRAFMFAFWAPQRDGAGSVGLPSCFLCGILGVWATVGSIAQISCFLSGLSRMGGPRRRGIGLPSCLLSGLLGWMNGPRQKRLGSGLLGRMGGPRRGGGLVALDSLHVSFLGFWVGRVSFLGLVGWVGRGDGVGFHWLLSSLGSLRFLGLGLDGWARQRALEAQRF